MPRHVRTTSWDPLHPQLQAVHTKLGRKTRWVIRTYGVKMIMMIMMIMMIINIMMTENHDMAGLDVS